MPDIRWLRLRLRSLFRSQALDDELDRELSLHFEQIVREQMEAGLGRADAERAARRAFGNLDVTRERCRDARRVRLLDDLVRDVRFAVRTLVGSPGFALTGILSLAVGIGANTAIFSLVDAVLLRLLPVQRPEALFFVQSEGTEGRSGAPPYPCFERLRAEVAAFERIAAMASDQLRLQVDGRLEQVFGQVVSGDYFELLGVKPAAGRLLTSADERLDPAVAVISYRYWQQRFGGRLDAIGKTITFRNRSFVIVGITAPGFFGLQPGRHVDVSLPITQDRGMLADAGAWWFDAVARLRPGVTMEQARAQADSVFQSFMRDRRQLDQMRTRNFARLTLTPAARGFDRLRLQFSMPLRLLTAISAAVLLIACANLGSLLLARGAARYREFAIRMAAGAGAGRLVRQLLTETLVLFGAGAAVGLVVAFLLVQVMTGYFAIGRNPIVLDVRYGWRLALYALGLALTAGVVTGLWPALRARHADPNTAIKQVGARMAGSRQFNLASRALVAGQIALSLVLLASAVLFVRTLTNLRGIDLGFRPRGVLTMSLDPIVAPQAAALERAQFWATVLARVRALPAVRSASISVLTPLSGRDTGRSIAVAGFQPRGGDDGIVRLNHVSEDYFRTFGVDLKAGRSFTAGDASRSLKVAILNESAARAYFVGRSPIGETIVLGDTNSYQVIGVVADHKHRDVRESATRFVFVPVWQPVDALSRITLSVASDQPMGALARAVTAEVHAVRSATLVSDVIGAEQQIDATLISERLIPRLATAFAALALGLAAIGLYGILSYAVARRRAEIGIRMALGAAPRRVVYDVARDVLLPVVAGLALGLPAALLVGRLAEGLLFGVTAADPAAYVVAATLLTLVASTAAWLPARRACAIDPAEALRGE